MSSPNAGRFFGESILIHERLDSVTVKANAATVSTSKRVLVFRAPVGIWTTQVRKLN
jgi:hypothetical protein